MEQENSQYQIKFFEQMYALTLQNYIQNKAIINTLVNIRAKLEDVDKSVLFDELETKMDAWEDEYINDAKL